jgi:uncharacterized protein YbjT (DUF2867 family)
MQYFVTGATGFIGKRLVRKLLGAARRGGALPHPRGQPKASWPSCSTTGAWTAQRARCRSSATSRATKLGVAADAT